MRRSARWRGDVGILCTSVAPDCFCCTLGACLCSSSTVGCWRHQHPKSVINLANCTPRLFGRDLFVKSHQPRRMGSCVAPSAVLVPQNHELQQYCSSLPPTTASTSHLLTPGTTLTACVFVFFACDCCVPAGPERPAQGRGSPSSCRNRRGRNRRHGQSPVPRFASQRSVGRSRGHTAAGEGRGRLSYALACIGRSYGGRRGPGLVGGVAVGHQQVPSQTGA